MSNSNNMYNILNKLNGLEARAQEKPAESKPKTRLQESMEQVLSEKYMGFKKLEKSIAAKGDVENPAAVAAAIGRKKYGKEKFQKAAAQGKKLGETAKPDFLDMDKDGNKTEPMKKAIADKKKGAVKEAAKPDFLDLDKDGDKNEPMKKAAKEKTYRHKGTYGTSYDPSDEEKAELAKKDTGVKRGRGRPKKGADSSTGEVKSWDFGAFGVGGKDVKLPKWKGAVTKHKMVGESIAQKFDAILEAIDLAEKKMTPAQMAHREEIVKGMKKNKADMKKRYGSRWEDVMYATATKQAMKESSNFTRANSMVDAAFNSITESMHLNENPTGLDTIINTYKYEVKQFMDGAELDTDLYDALYDYYLNAGRMPYGIAKARTGDPSEWVAQEFANDVADYIGEGQHTQQAMDLNPDFKKVGVAPTLGGKFKAGVKKVASVIAPSDEDLLAQLEKETGGRRPVQVRESREVQIDECGMSPIAGMAAEAEQDTGVINISTNMSSDGNKNVSITANNDAADQLLQMLKLAGVKVNEGDFNADGSYNTSDDEAIEFGEYEADQEEVEQEVEEEKDPRYEASTTPDETVLPVQSQIEGGDGDVAGQQKEMTPDGYKFGDNPMAMKRADEGVDGLDTMGRKFMREYEGIKIKKWEFTKS